MSLGEEHLPGREDILAGKVVLVVGGVGLLGRAVSSAILSAGGKIVLASRNPEGLAVAGAAKSVRAIKVDVCDSETVSNMFNVASSCFGRVDAVVNSSFPRNERFGAKFENVRHEDFLDNVGQHLGSAFLVCQKAFAYFSEQGGGNIVNVSSIYGALPPRFEVYDGTSMTKEVEYVVSKAGINQLTRYLAAYAKGRNIRINCVSPGGILAGQPNSFVKNYGAYCLNKGMLDGADVAGTVIYLLSDLSTFVNGQIITVDDGYSL